MNFLTSMVTELAVRAVCAGVIAVAILVGAGVAAAGITIGVASARRRIHKRAMHAKRIAKL